MTAWFKKRLSGILGNLRSDNATAAKNVASNINLHSYSLTFLNCQMSENPDPPGVEFLRTISKFKKTIKFHRRLFTSSLNGKIRLFHVVVAQKRQRNVQKSEMHLESCCFAY